MSPTPSRPERAGSPDRAPSGPGRLRAPFPCLALALALLLPATRAGLAVPPVASALQEPDTAFWSPTLGEALEAVGDESRWVLAYLRSPRGPAEPERLEEALRARGLLPAVLGARVRSHEVREALAAYGIETLPALVLLDPQSRRVAVWTGRLRPAQVVGRVASLVRAYRDQQEAIEKRLAEATELLAGDAEREAALACLQVLEASAAATRHRDRAGVLLGEIRARADRAYLELVAREGIVSDERLGRELERLATRFPLPSIVERIRREQTRFDRREIGGDR